MPRCIGFVRENPVAEYVIFTEGDSPADDFKQEGYECIYDEEVEDLPSQFPLESNLIVERT